MFSNPDSISRFSGEQQSAVCAHDGAAVDSVEICKGGLFGCDGKAFCETHLTRCASCNEPYCRSCAGRFLADGLCWECLAMRADGYDQCPECGSFATFTRHEGDFTETHGLECGPYEHWHEEWLTCDKCRAKTDEKEVRLFNQVAA